VSEGRPPVIEVAARSPGGRRAQLPAIAKILKLSHEDLARIAAADEGGASGGVLGGILSPLSPGGRVFGLF
jgi:hypothetical protein